MGQAQSVVECCKAGRAEPGPLEKQSRMGMNQHGLRMASSHINIPDACSTSMDGRDAAQRERQTMPADLTSVMLETGARSDDDDSDSDAVSSHDEILHQQSQIPFFQNCKVTTAIWYRHPLSQKLEDIFNPD